MSESRWKHWSSGSKDKKLGFSVFMEGRAADEAKEQGLVADYYGRWMDPKTGEVVAKTVNDRLEYIEQGGGDPQPDMGNPTNAASGMKPADRARSLGLQSDGSGGYVDPNTGEVAARTVNNELVFYDGRGGGGAVSDGGGGQAMVQSAPSWRDPVSGIIIVPPAKPETPYETAAVPDPVPATAPMGFDSFLDKKRKEMYASEAESNPYDMVTDRFADKTANGRASGDEARMGAISLGDEKMAEYKDEISEILGGIDEEKREQFVKEFVGEIIRQAKNLYADQVGVERDPKNKYFSDPLSYARDKADEFAPRIEQESFEDAVGVEEGDVIEGEYTNWTFEMQGIAPGGEVRKYSAIGETEALDDPEIRKANRGYGVTSRGGEVSSVINFDWRVKDEFAGDVPKDGGLRQAADGVSRAAVAMDAFKVWRNEILPNIPVGTVVKANPEGYRDELKRVYKLAGFGVPNWVNINEMEGVVYLDASGKKKLYPTWGDEAKWDGRNRLDPKTGEPLESDEEGYFLKNGKRTWDEQGDRISEMYIPMMDTNLNTEEELMVAEILFG